MANEELDRVQERLRSIESNLKRTMQHLKIDWMEPSAMEGVPDDVVEMVNNGDLIGAIKRYRELTGAGLSEAQAVLTQQS